MVIKSSREQKRLAAEAEAATADDEEPCKFRWIRSALLTSPPDLNAMLEFGKELLTHAADKHGLALELCYDVFGQRVYWEMNFDTLDEINAFKEDLMVDEEFGTLMEGHQDIWQPNSYQETIVSVIRSIDEI